MVFPLMLMGAAAPVGAINQNDPAPSRSTKVAVSAFVTVLLPLTAFLEQLLSVEPEK